MMPLDMRERGALESSIDSAVRGMPGFCRVFRTFLPRELSVKEFEDYAIGFAHEYIVASFNSFYVNVHSQPVHKEIAVEVLQIIYKRSRELKDAIFSAG